MADQLQAAATFLSPHLAEYWENLKAWSKDLTHPYLVYSGQEVYMMLGGLVVENLCKGHLVRQIPQSERVALGRNSKLPKSLKSHSLVSLVRRTGFSLSAQQEHLLRRLQRAVEWHGRYPIPVSATDTAPTVTLEDGSQVGVNFTGELDAAQVFDLIAAIRDHVGAPLSEAFHRELDA